MAFPGLALARESSGIQYESEVPTVPNHESIPSAKHHDGSNNQSEAESEATGSKTPGGGGAGGNGNSNTGGGTPSGQSKQGPGGGTGTGTGGSKPAGGNVSESKPVANPGPSTAGSSDGSSSPLLPILIALAVLAAISVGAFYFRQRRQGANSSPSPKAS